MLFFVLALFMALVTPMELVSHKNILNMDINASININTIIIVPRVTLARLYKWMDEKMKFLWPNSLHLNTVHVNDVAKAICKP